MTGKGMTKKRIEMKRVVFFTLILSLLTLSCGKDEKPLPKDGYEIVTLSAIDITTNKATLTGKFRAGANYKDAQHGFVFINANGAWMSKLYPVEESGEFSYTVEGLEAGLPYSFRAFVVIDGQMQTGEEHKFVTFTEKGYQMLQSAVDLGTGVKWAPMNLGATKVEDGGDFYAWGELGPKDIYTMNTYLPAAASISEELDVSTDIATISLGGTWRMPTAAELKKLITDCDHSVTTVGGKKGILFTGKKSGHTDKTLFLPAAGFAYEKTIGKEAGEDGKYWSSSYYSIDQAHHLKFSVSVNNSLVMAEGYRYYGFSIRPVCD